MSRTTVITMDTSPDSLKQGVLVMRACFPVRKVCSRVTGALISSARRVPERSINPLDTTSCIFFPITSSGFSPEMT